MIFRGNPSRNGGAVTPLRAPGRLSRRCFLRAAGGAALALPLMDSLGARAATTTPPKRLVLMYNPNGTIHEQWFPTNVVSETEFDVGRILAPLAKNHRDRLLILKGVDNDVAERTDNNGGPHQRGIGALFTGQTLGVGSFRDGCGSLAGWANGISVDQAVANVIGADTPYKSLELGVRASDNDVQGRISYAGPGQPLPPTNDPMMVYDRLFGASAQKPLDPNDPTDARKSVLDTVQEQFALMRPKLSKDDQEKLDAHLTLVRDVELRLGIGRPNDQVCPAPSPPGALDPSSEVDMEFIGRAHFDLLAAAFACDLTRVASVQFSTGFNKLRYPWVDSLGEGHSLSHTGPSNFAAQEELVNRYAWHASELAYFLDRLAAIPEGDGTVLDNTLVLWGNEISVGNTHSLKDIPYLVAGNAGGAIRTGRFLEVASQSNTNLLLAILHAFGVEADTFGHPEHCTGALDLT